MKEILEIKIITLIKEPDVTIQKTISDGRAFFYLGGSDNSFAMYLKNDEIRKLANAMLELADQNPKYEKVEEK